MAVSVPMARPYTFPITRRAGYRFDGVDDYIDCGNDVSLNFGSGNFTVALWFRSYSVGAAHIMIATQETDYPYEGWLLGHYGASKIRFAGKDAAHTNFAAEFSFTDTGGFHHLVAIREGQSFRLYLDGSLKDDATAAVDNIPFNDILSVGARPAPISAYYDGVISEVALFGEALSSMEIRRLYEGRAAPNDVDGCVLWLPLYEGHTMDRSGSGNHGVNHGAIYTLG